MFDEFTAWWEAKTLRVTGAAPAARTLKNKRNRLRRAAAGAGADTEHRLAMLVSDRSTVERLLDALYAQHSPGTVVGDVAALVQFGDWSVAQGWIGACTITKADRPKLVPQKADHGLRRGRDRPPAVVG